MHPVQCHNEADFRGHADIEPNLFFEGVYKFCQERYDTTQVLDATDDPTNAAYDDGDGRLARNASWRYRDWHGVNHDFRVWWEAGCRVTVGKQSVRRPLGEEGDPVWTPGCYEIMGSTHYEFIPPLVTTIKKLSNISIYVTMDTLFMKAVSIKMPDSLANLIQTDPWAGGKSRTPAVKQSPPIVTQAPPPPAAAAPPPPAKMSQHHETQNLSEESKDTNSSGGTNRSSGESAGGTRSNGKPKGELSSTVDILLNKALGFGAASEAEKKKSGAA
ncbi:hypothetical protein COL5a_010505 [Colletotrichum fioriniae]|uniref:uncharacterized protein n=1 Tax=Colletotrichum fioriniae TaxID=710243 RepID=UPI0023008A79|nr:uncharacterized protein COL516b_011151 [Colletotrichum fioriniae]KAJ0296936.1 hypothetical protein COL516b_011151 [Colletotrichum fioriniae]KAJ0318780.1 hypothetical protein COL5a_010505 [Colletotrichum fioriniae]KAJ3939724.1 hypothetical protein N0V96_010510 [Colletotrichum fioriniae]